MPAFTRFLYENLLLSKVKNEVKTKFKSLLNRNSILESSLDLIYESNNYIKCNWRLGLRDQISIDSKKIFCLGLRIFDVTLSNSKESSTCIMKEIEINKNLKNYVVASPISDGRLFLELGYRTAESDWVDLCSSFINLGERINSQNPIDDSWFYLTKSSKNLPFSLHERIYQLSNFSKNGGSEKIQLKEKI
tara:strand:+ start:41583 stop:42155 length:573 start_codon:yes stop_codon:yes gene_type:complete